MDYAIRALIERLAEKGMDVSEIPPFVRVLAKTVSIDPFISLERLNKRMTQWGYYDFELDEYTFQLLMVILTESFNNSEPGETLWFEHGFNSAKVIRIDVARRPS